MYAFQNVTPILGLLYSHTWILKYDLSAASVLHGVYSDSDLDSAGEVPRYHVTVL